MFQGSVLNKLSQNGDDCYVFFRVDVFPESTGLCEYQIACQLFNKSELNLKFLHANNGGVLGGLFGTRHRSSLSPIRPKEASSNRSPLFNIFPKSNDGRLGDTVVQRNHQSFLNPNLPHTDSSNHSSVLYNSPQFTSTGSSCLSNISPEGTLIKQDSNGTGAATYSMLEDWTGMDREKAKEYIISCQ
ncbi:uncharacterized protein LOC108223571 [Daucus carota subsp. sativus]|uniref:uncharacterized protein LOC108223571 n=1 Tax=Daucus carota subsp. sativus TaxID=79200 RepID=UPI0030828D92